MKILSGSSNISLAKQVAKKLNSDLINVDIGNFTNGEKRVRITDLLNNESVILIQSFSNPTNTNIIETLLLIDALKQSGALNVTLVIPWMGYSLQDKVFRSGEPLAAKVIAEIFSNHFVKRVVLLDLHNESILGFFSAPTSHLAAQPLFEEYIRKNFDPTKSIIVSPDFGGLKRSRRLADSLEMELANIDKSRSLSSGKVEANDLHGNVKNKIALVFDDVVMSGSTVVEATKILKANGAKEVHYLATHGVFCGDALTDISKAETDNVVITNTIEHQEIGKNITVLDASSIIAQFFER